MFSTSPTWINFSFRFHPINFTCTQLESRHFGEVGVSQTCMVWSTWNHSCRMKVLAWKCLNRVICWHLQCPPLAVGNDLFVACFIFSCSPCRILATLMLNLFSRLFRIWLSKGCENCEISSLGMSVACCQSWAFDKTQENCCRLGCNDWLSWKHQCVHRVIWLWRGRQLWCFVMLFLGHPWSMDYHSTPCWAQDLSFL